MGSRTRALSLESPVVPVLLPHLLSVILPLADSGGPGTSEAIPLARAGSFSPFGPSTVWSPQGPPAPVAPPIEQPQAGGCTEPGCLLTIQAPGWLGSGFWDVPVPPACCPGQSPIPRVSIGARGLTVPLTVRFWGKSLTPQMLSVSCLYCCYNS